MPPAGQSRQRIPGTEAFQPWLDQVLDGALATGLAQVTWVLAEVRSLLGSDAGSVKVAQDVDAFEKIAGACLFVWEAFVSSSAKGANDQEDAEIGAKAYRLSREAGAQSDVRCEGSSLSLIGVALARAGWINDVESLSREVYVVRATV